MQRPSPAPDLPEESWSLWYLKKERETRERERENKGWKDFNTELYTWKWGGKREEKKIGEKRKEIKKRKR